MILCSPRDICAPPRSETCPINRFGRGVRRKPHPRIYQAALTRLGVPAAGAVFVGDRLKEDVRGPKEVGMRAVLTRQFRQEDPRDAAMPPDAVIASLGELPAVLALWA